MFRKKIQAKKWRMTLYHHLRANGLWLESTHSLSPGPGLVPVSGKGSQSATKAISQVLTDFFSCFPKVCRVAYEIMQTLHPDASANFHSLDDIYYFGGQNAHNQIAIYPHEPRTADEIPMEPGDIIGVAGNHWDGYSKGVNRKLGRTGLYPSYKVREKIETVKYPTYPEAEK